MLRDIVILAPSPAMSKEEIPRTPSLQPGNTNKTTMVELSLDID
jgi:hypothetical protein